MTVAHWRGSSGSDTHMHNQGPSSTPRSVCKRRPVNAPMATSDAIPGTFCMSFDISPESLHNGIGAAGRCVRSLRILGILTPSARRPGRMGRSR
jgi:hypothetical protein